MATAVGWQRPLVPGRGVAPRPEGAESFAGWGPARGGGGRRASAALGLRGRPGGARPAARHAGKGAAWVPLLQAPRDRV